MDDDEEMISWMDAGKGEQQRAPAMNTAEKECGRCIGPVGGVQPPMHLPEQERRIGLGRYQARNALKNKNDSPGT